MAMEVDASAGNRKRALDETEDDATIKKRRIGDENAISPPVAKGLSALVSTIGSVFSFGAKAVDSQPQAASTNPTPPLQNGAIPALPPNPIPAAATIAAAVPGVPVAPSPLKSRPAIKLAALRGTKYDTGESAKGKASEPKKKPGQPPAAKKGPPAKRGRPRKIKETQAVSTGVDSDVGAVENSPTKPKSAKKLFNIPLLSKTLVDSTADELSASEVPGISPLKSRSYDLNKRLAESTNSPMPKGILSPTKKKGPRPQKSVTFNGSAGGGEVFFEDLPKVPSAKKGKPGRKAQKVEVQPDPDEITCAICSKPDSKAPNEIILCDNCDFAVHQVCYEVAEIPTGDWLCKSCSQEDVLNTPKKPVELATSTAVVTAPPVEIPDIPNLDTHLRAMQRMLLDRCAGRRRISMFGQDEAYEKAQQLVEQTVVAGEGNSMLLIGPRGCGKTTMLENIIQDLSRSHFQDFYVVRLNGFIHTDDKLALKEIWRQLGKQMKVEDDLLNRSNYADTMASLLALLSHPSEILGTDSGVTSQSVVFIIDEFDMFAAHPRQTLLYNLFDIAQSRKAPIAVLGSTTRLDVVEMLEKRVKSRFSHRYIYLSLPRSLPGYWQICRQGLMLGEIDPEIEGLDTRLEGYVEFQKYWNRKIEELYKQREFQDLLQYHFYTTKSPSAFFNEWILPLASISAKNLNLEVPAVGAELTSLTPPDSRMQLLSTLSDLDLSLLIAAARLDIVADTDTVNFAMAYDEYSSLAGRQRVQSATSGMLAVSGNVKVWSRGVAGIAWERLIELGLLVPAGIGGIGAGSRMQGGLEGKMWKIDVALEEIPTATKLSATLAKWCKEI